MNRLVWPIRFVAIVAAGALLLTGVTLGLAPRLWRIANAHDESAVKLPDFQPLSQRTEIGLPGRSSAVFLFSCARSKLSPAEHAQVVIRPAVHGYF